MRNFFAFFLLLSFSAFSQDDSTQRKTSSLKFDLNYINNSVYLGRKDSATLSYFTPGIFYVAPSGFFASANLSFLTQESRVDAASVEAGYDYSTGNFDASLSGTKFFYNGQSQNVKSTVSAGLNAYLTYETPYITPVLNGSASFGNNQPDYFAGFGLEHRFYADKLTIIPSVTANGGTQHFYDGYYKLRKGGKKKPATASVTQEVLNASTFKILDYELSADVTYKVKNLSFYATPAYAIATNPNVIVTTAYRANGAVFSSQSKVENLGNSFYCTVGLNYRLPLK